MNESDVDFVFHLLARSKHKLAPTDQEPPLRMVAAAAHSLANFWPARNRGWFWQKSTPRMCPRARLLSEDGQAIIGAAREMLIAAERWREP